MYEHLVRTAFDDELRKIAEANAKREHRKVVNEVVSRYPNLLPKEKEKAAATRAVKEWRANAASGNMAGADQIAQGYNQLGLAPRNLHNISAGGVEGAVDRMMGSATPGQVGPNQSGYLARKIYKPDSPLATGADMTQVLQAKQHAINTARSLSPEAREMVPDMYGHREMRTGNQIRHTSDHEYIPMGGKVKESPEMVQKMQDTVVKPLRDRGIHIGDLPEVRDGKVVGNASNMLAAQGGGKIIDFAPHVPGKVELHGTSISTSTGRTDTAFNKSNLPSLRKEVYNPTQGYHPSMGALAQNPRISNQANGPLSQASTAIARPAAGAEAATAMARPAAAPSQAATAFARPQAAAPAAATAMTRPAGMASEAATAVARKPIATAAGALSHAPAEAATAIARKPIAAAAGRLAASPLAGKVENAAAHALQPLGSTALSAASRLATKVHL